MTLKKLLLLLASLPCIAACQPDSAAEDLAFQVNQAEMKAASVGTALGHEIRRVDELERKIESLEEKISALEDEDIRQRARISNAEAMAMSRGR